VVAYNFQARFADAVASGAKRQTIRLPRKNGHVKVGSPSSTIHRTSDIGHPQAPRS